MKLSIALKGNGFCFFVSLFFIVVVTVRISLSPSKSGMLKNIASVQEPFPASDVVRSLNV